LFGQCWDGEGSIRSAFALESGVDGLTDDKLIAMENTLDFLNRYHLNWRDYMTQCILSHILSDEYQINQNRLELFYDDCLNKDQVLDELAALQEDNIYRRQLDTYDQNKSKTLFFLFYDDEFSFSRILLRRSICTITKIG
jgi:hypothetical protein